MSEHERLEELAHLYPLGGLDPEERSRVDQHLATGCDRCEATLLESLKLAGQLLDAVVPVPPSPIVKRELLERARRESPLSVATPPRRPPSPAWLAAAAALLVVATGFGFYSQSLRDRSDSLRASLLEEQTSRRSAEERLRDVESRMATLTAPDARAVSLSGQGDTAGARARAFLDPENRQLSLYVYNLPPLPPGQTYQLWVIVGGTPVSAGTFDVEPDGSTRYDADPIPALGPGSTVTVAVTVELAGGVPQPTGPMVLVES